jgi:hypothetical protein
MEISFIATFPKNNLIITDGEKEGEPKGMLIDHDLAEELDSRFADANFSTAKF